MASTSTANACAIDAERMARDAMDRSADAMQRAQDATERAMARSSNDRSMDAAARRATGSRTGISAAGTRVSTAFHRSHNFGGDAFAPLASISPVNSHQRSRQMLQPRLADARANLELLVFDVTVQGYSNNFAFQTPKAYSPNQSGWDWKQDPDPADSLYRVAQDAMNRGDYRRSADLFSHRCRRNIRSPRASPAPRTTKR